MKISDGGHGFSSKAAVIGSLVLVAATIGFHIVVATGRARFPFDYEGFHFPLLHFNAQILWSFELPGYNPFVYAGLPYHNSVQAGFWYPPHAVFALLTGFVGGPTLFQAQALNLIHFALGAIGTMLLLRELHVGCRAALTAGLLLIVNGHVLAQAQHLGVVETMAWLPLALLGVVRIVRAPSRALVTLLGAVLAMPILIGFLPMALAFYVIIFGAMAYAVTRSAFRRQAMLACGGSVLIAAGLCGPVVLPMLATLGQAVDLSPHGSMPAKMLATLLAPNVFGVFRLSCG